MASLKHLAYLVPVCFALLAGAATPKANGQAAPPPDPSPFAPGDLRKPIFNTRTPVYDSIGQQAKSAATVVAEVDGRPVTLGDVADAVKDLPAGVRSMPYSDLFQIVLAQLIRQQALVIMAQQQGLDENPAVRRKIKAADDRVLTNELLNDQIGRTITEKLLLERYDKDIAGKPGPEEVHARVILVASEQAAAGIIAELKGGADFAVLARRQSQDATAQLGGDLGFVSRDGLNAEVGSVAFSLPPGQVSSYPVRSSGGWFVVRVDERRSSPAPHFAEVREQLLQMMIRENVPDLMTRALSGVTVREYDINGKEKSAAKAE